MKMRRRQKFSISFSKSSIKYSRAIVLNFILVSRHPTLAKKRNREHGRKRAISCSIFNFPSAYMTANPKVLEADAIKLNFSFNLKCLLIAVQSEKFQLAGNLSFEFLRNDGNLISFYFSSYFFFLRVLLLCSLSTESNFMIYFQFISSTQTATTFCLDLAFRMYTHAQLTSHTNRRGKVCQHFEHVNDTTALNCLWK